MNSRPTPRPRIAISCGDPNGIGLEVAFKALAELQSGSDPEFDVLLFAPESAIHTHLETLSIKRPVFDLVSTPGGQNFQTQFGVTDAAAGKLSMVAFEQAVDCCLNLRADAVITAPISKESIELAGYNKPGHTEYLAETTCAESHAMMMVDNTFRIALVTTHIPILKVAAQITAPLVQEKLGVLVASLRQDFNVKAPRIAVLGLNPHAGEGGMLGVEEKEIIIPAICAARDADAREPGARRVAPEDGSESLTIDGPFPADAFFGMRRQNNYDGILAMYHDQGLIPFKALAFETGVNYTAGLPIVRTSPDHGTAFDIAGQNKASSTSMAAAISLGCEIVHNRNVAHR